MKGLIKWRKRHFLKVDLLVVTLVVAVANVIVQASVRTEQLAHLLDGIRATLYGTASAGCAALLGFVITTTTITDAVVQNPHWASFRQSLAYVQVQDIYFGTMRWLGVSTLLFLVFLVADTDVHPQLLCEVVTTWLVCVLTARMWRGIGFMEQLLRLHTRKMKEMAPRE